MAIVDRPGVDGSEHIAPEQIFGGRVDDVLKSPRIAPAPATLEEARKAPGRAEKIEQLTRLIEASDPDGAEKHWRRHLEAASAQLMGGPQAQETVDLFPKPGTAR